MSKGDKKMTELQSKLLDMFKWYHNLCEEQGLIYFALGGTALGAVRHNGFIPWDDDIDVGMPRKDYEKLKEISKEISNNSKYRLEFPLENKDFTYPYGKIYDTTTTLIENTRYKAKRGIYIDIFPIDGIGNTLEESLCNFKPIDNKINILCTRVCALRKERKFYKNAAILLSRCITEKIWGFQRIMHQIDIMSKQYAYDKYDYVANVAGNWHEKEIMKKNWIGNRKIYKFEDCEIYCVEDIHSYLTRMYGDYMKLPPVEKRVTHHDYITMDLEKSYID